MGSWARIILICLTVFGMLAMVFNFRVGLLRTAGYSHLDGNLEPFRVLHPLDEQSPCVRLGWLEHVACCESVCATQGNWCRPLSRRRWKRCPPACADLLQLTGEHQRHHRPSENSVGAGQAVHNRRARTPSWGCYLSSCVAGPCEPHSVARCVTNVTAYSHGAALNSLLNWTGELT